jgi:hypothetical protein
MHVGRCRADLNCDELREELVLLQLLVVVVGTVSWLNGQGPFGSANVETIWLRHYDLLSPLVSCALMLTNPWSQFRVVYEYYDKQ